MTFSDFTAQQLFTNAQIKFAAAKYRVLSLEKCTGRINTTTEEAIYTTARAIKQTDPTVKIIFYWATDQQGISCYEAGKEWLAHPEWYLRDDNGNLVGKSPVLDPSNAAAAAWWVSVPMRGDGNGTWKGQPTYELIDGVLADSAGFVHFANISVARQEALTDAKYEMIGDLQAALTKANGGVVMANGLSMYPNQDPRYPAGDRNVHVLNYADAAMNEHTAVFESVNSKNGSLNVQMVSDNLDAILRGATMDNGSKTLFVSTWPGLYAGLGNGYPTYPPVASGGEPSPTTPAEWTNALRSHYDFAQALFLSIATTNMYWFYGGVWYSSFQGPLPCPSGCWSPPEWYPDLEKPLGAPLGERVLVKPYVWTRKFEHATVYLDLNQPNSSKVTFASDVSGRDQTQGWSP